MNDSVVTEGQAWVASLAAHGYSSATVRVREESLRAFRRYLDQAGILRCQDVSAAVLEDWRRQMLERRLAVPTVEQRLRSIRLFFDFLEAGGKVFDNPGRGVRMHIRPAPLPRVPSVAQVLAVLAAPDVKTAAGLRDRALLELMYAAGTRLEETTGLEMEDCDFDARTVRIRGKGGRERLLPLGGTCLKWLGRYLAHARPLLLGQAKGEPRVWIRTSGGRPLQKQGVAVRVRQHMRAAGLPRQYSPHALRRAAATHMLQGGANPFVIRQFLGHASMRHLCRYLRVSVRDLRQMHRASVLGK